MRSIVCNRNECCVCNQAEEMRLEVMTYTLPRDYIPLTRITYQAEGLDKKDIFGSFAYEFELSHKSRRSRVYHQDEVLHIINSVGIVYHRCEKNTAYG